MRKVPCAIGIDPSLTSTGLVVLGRDGDLAVAEALRPPKGLTGAARLDALHQQFSRWLRSTRAAIDLGRYEAPIVAALEGYGYSANSQRLAELGEWVGLIKWELWRNNIGFFVVPPARLKKFVTGKGTAQKDEMRLAIYKRWHFEHPSNDVVDAYGLARIALAIAGGADGLTKAQAEVVSAIRSSAREANRAA